MCGLAGIVSTNGAKIDAAIVDRMSNSLRHRGPDDEGSYVDGAVGLGFRRLSILDLSASGHQPMISDNGRYVLVYNGEIYNYIELRKELQDRGYRFRSSGDTEVLLNAYDAWGKDCLHKFNGMWAFIIYDTLKKVIFGSRDRFGVKPLYCYRSKEVMLFASEIKAILSSGYYSEGVNWRVASMFLIDQRLDTTDETFYAGITKVAAGSAFEMDLKGNYKEWKYWSLDDSADEKADEPASTFCELFEDAVRLRMRSDVPVGILLSGGLDSTSIICSMARIKNGVANNASDPVWAFSYMSPEFDEANYIQDTLKQTHARLVPLKLNGSDLLKKLSEYLWFQDEPVHTMTALIVYELVKLAADNGIKVLLAGSGADETIAGYPSSFPQYWATLLATDGFRRVQEEIRAFNKIHGGNSTEALRSLLTALLKNRLRSFAPYRSLSRWRWRRELSKHTWFSPDLLRSVPDQDLPCDLSLNTDLKRSVERANLPLYLRIDDRNSMAHSVELRSPFMDYRLISYAFKLPANWKMRGPWNKFILRESMRGKIPESVRTRPDKMGFPFPTQKWLNDSLLEPVRDLLESQATRERGIYNLGLIKRDLDQKRIDELDSYSVFNILQFEAWCALSKGCRRQSL